MALIERDEALELIGENRLSGIYNAITRAWDAYLDYPMDKRIVHSERSRASLMHDHMIDEAARYAVVSSGIEIIIRRKLYLFVLDARLAIRFKMFDETLRTKNQLTKQVQQFKEQSRLPGVTSAHNLEAGYVLDKDGLSLKAVHLVCPNGPNIPYWDVLMTEKDKISIVEDLFSKRVDSEEEVQASRVKRKEQAKIITIKKNDN